MNGDGVDESTDVEDITEKSCVVELSQLVQVQVHFPGPQTMGNLGLLLSLAEGNVPVFLAVVVFELLRAFGQGVILCVNPRPTTFFLFIACV